MEIVTSRSELDGLVREWEALWRRDANATPFQSPHWLLPWWDHFGSGELAVATARRDGRLEALIPTCILRDEDESLGLLLGTGISDYLDALGNPESLEALAALDCQLWDLQQLRPASPLLSAVPPVSWTENVEEHDRCPVLRFGTERRSLHFEKKLRYYARALERQASPQWLTADESSIDEVMSALFALHAARWQRRGLPGVLGDEVIQSFHRQVARRFLNAGVLRLYALRAAQKIISVFYGFAHAGTVYYYLGGYDPEFEKLSVGMLTIAHAVEEARGEGAHAFDFLRGAEEYKYAWGAEDGVNRRRQLMRA